MTIDPVSTFVIILLHYHLHYVEILQGSIFCRIFSALNIVILRFRGRRKVNMSYNTPATQTKASFQQLLSPSPAYYKKKYVLIYIFYLLIHSKSHLKPGRMRVRLEYSIIHKNKQKSRLLYGMPRKYLFYFFCFLVLNVIAKIKIHRLCKFQLSDYNGS